MGKRILLGFVFFVFLASCGTSGFAASWFDGIPGDAISWLKSEVKATEEWEPNVQGKRFGDFKINISFDGYQDSYAVQIIELSTGQVVANYTNRTWKSFTASEITSALNSATPLESLPAAPTTTAPTTVETASTPFSSDTDEDKAPLVSSETPAASADRTGLRIIENVVLPKAETKEQQEKVKEMASQSRVLGGTVVYEDFEYAGIDGNTLELVTGIEKSYDGYSAGFLVPISYVDITGGDWKKLGAMVYLKKDISKENVDFSIGLNAALEQTWMDVAGVDDSLAYGIGPMASATFALKDISISLGTDLLFMANSEYESVNILTSGINVGIPLGRFFVLNGYTYRTDNFDSDNDYYIVGATGTYMVSDVFGINAGFNTVTSHDEYDSNSYYLGGAWRY